MKKIIRLTESDLARIVRRTINEMDDEDLMRSVDRNWEDREEDEDDDYSGLKDVHRKWYDQNMGKHKEDRDEDDDYKDRSMHSPYYGDDEEWGQTDMGEEELQDLIEEAKDILENELGFSIDAINEMDEFDILDALRDHSYDELAGDIEYLMEKEGFYSDEEELEEELEEGWDDFTQKRRYPEDYKAEKYRKVPKGVFKKGHKIDFEGTTLSPKEEDPFDEYEDFEDEDFV